MWVSVPVQLRRHIGLSVRASVCMYVCSVRLYVCMYVSARLRMRLHDVLLLQIGMVRLRKETLLCVSCWTRLEYTTISEHDTCIVTYIFVRSDRRRSLYLFVYIHLHVRVAVLHAKQVRGMSVLPES